MLTDIQNSLLTKSVANLETQIVKEPDRVVKYSLL